MFRFLIYGFLVLGFVFAGFLLGDEHSARFCEFNAECLHPLFQYSRTTAIRIGMGAGLFAGTIVCVFLHTERSNTNDNC